LDDEYDGGVPRWLGDEEVRSGIRALLQYDRCHEEELRLRKERCNLQEWFIEEWECIEAARVADGDYPVTPHRILLIFLPRLGP
jgi:hypothetical protein